ncbi:uncharacterized protein LOC127714991 [Mytilus californianus]|uniref:uncharacterized protein LOC127714991 n=1 Tax=Mytilus californianus TaxID=6549 RepID=UPI0022459B06|nr:uncharacterized protein LOC127714991 [Mytilus californianus]
MQNFIILSAVCFVLCTSFRLKRNTLCTYSYQCTTTTPCCRDANGKTLTHDEDFGGLGLPLSGTCSSVIGKKGDICDSSCGCNLGLTCYRPVTGVCCLPRKCYDAAWVKQQEQYWANCHPPTCYYPV